MSFGTPEWSKEKIQDLQRRIADLEEENDRHKDQIERTAFAHDAVTSMREADEQMFMKRIKELEFLNKQYIEQNTDLDAKWQMALDFAEPDKTRIAELEAEKASLQTRMIDAGFKFKERIAELEDQNKFLELQRDEARDLVGQFGNRLAELDDKYAILSDENIYLRDMANEVERRDELLRKFAAISVKYSDAHSVAIAFSLLLCDPLFKELIPSNDPEGKI